MFLFPGVLCVIPFAFMQLDGWSIKDISTSSYVAVVYSIIAITLANIFYMYGLKRRVANSVGIFQYLESVSLFIAAWFILGERPDAKFAIGAALVFLGIYLAEFHLPKKRKVKIIYSRWHQRFTARIH